MLKFLVVLHLKSLEWPYLISLLLVLTLSILLCHIMRSSDQNLPLFTLLDTLYTFVYASSRLKYVISSWHIEFSVQPKEH